MALTDYLMVCKNRRLLIVTLLGFASGLPLVLTGATLQAWYTVAGVNILTIGFLSWAGLPYVFKFLWAPVMDRYTLPFLGRRRGWMLVTQVFLCLGLVLMAFLNPNEDAVALGIIALCVAFLSASQDIAIDAYRADILEPQERGIGAALNVAAYRIAMLVAGGVALIFADWIGWQLTYLLMAGLMGVGILASVKGMNPSDTVLPPVSMKEAVIEPFREFFQRKQVIIILLFIVLYKLGDAFAFSLTTTFLIRSLEFTPTDIGLITKGVGLAATLLGVFVAGVMMLRMNLFNALIIFGVLQALANFTFMLLAIVGKNYSLMAAAIFIENFCAGLGTAAFVAFIMSLCDHRFTATQFALLSALSSVGRVVVGPLAAMMVSYVGWVQFYFWTVLIAIPGIIILWFLREGIKTGTFSPSLSVST
jgi:MFS transporter, PAT family, beta-lactamase induction signal transducer AmpG